MRAQLPMVLDAETGEQVTLPRGRAALGKPKARRMRLRTLEDVEHELERLIREVRSGKLSTEVGTRVTYMLRTLGEFKVIATLKQRVLVLEGRMDAGADDDDDAPSAGKALE